MTERFRYFPMNFKPFSATLGALLLATALTGCTGSTSGTSGASGGGSGDVIATVGSASVTRADLNQTLEGIYGESTLPQLIDTQLLNEALKAKNGSVSDAEVDAELTHLQEQNARVKTEIEAGGPRAQVIKNEIRRNLTVQKLLTQGITSDATKEKAFLTQYATYYSTPLQMRLGILAATTKVRIDQLARQLKDKPDSFNALVDEQKGKVAQDRFAGGSTPDIGSLVEPKQFPPAVAKALATAKKGQVTPPLALAPTGPYLIIKVLDRKDASKPDFAKLQPQVETDYKLAQVAQTELKKIPQMPQKLPDAIKQLIAVRAQPNMQTGEPGAKTTLREALTLLLNSASTELLTSLRKASTVQINDTAYKEVAKRYEQPTAAPGETGNTATGNSAATTTTNSAATTTTNSAAPAKP